MSSNDSATTNNNNNNNMLSEGNAASLGPISRTRQVPLTAAGADVGGNRLTVGRGRARLTKKQQSMSSSRSEMGTPWGVALKPIPQGRKVKAPNPDETKAAKLSVPKVSFTNRVTAVDLEEFKVQKSTLRRVSIVNTEVRVVSTYITSCLCKLLPVRYR